MAYPNRVEVTEEHRAELRGLVGSGSAPGRMLPRARRDGFDACRIRSCPSILTSIVSGSDSIRDKATAFMSDHSAPLVHHDSPTRPDLTRSLAVILRAPHFMIQQQGYRDEQGVWQHPPDDTRERFQPILEDFATYLESSLPAGLRRSGANLAACRYNYGPGGAGMYEAVAYVFNLLADATKIADVLTIWGTIAGWALAAKQYWNARLQAAGQAGQKVEESDQLAFSATAVQAVCVYHTLLHYRLTGAVEISVYSRFFDSGCADLPSGGELYNVRVSNGIDT